MSWPDVALAGMCIAGFVASLYIALPYVRTRSEEQRRELALKAANERIDKLEGAIADFNRPRLPAQIRRGA